MQIFIRLIKNINLIAFGRTIAESNVILYVGKEKCIINLFISKIFINRKGLN